MEKEKSLGEQLMELARGDYQPLRPDQTISYRENLVREMQEFPRWIAERSDQVNVGYIVPGTALDWVKATAKLLERAMILLWRADLWQAAQNGHEVFKGQTFHAQQEFMPREQFWIPDRDLYLTPDVHELNGIDYPTTLVGNLIVAKDDYLYLVGFHKPHPFDPKATAAVIVDPKELLPTLAMTRLNYGKPISDNAALIWAMYEFTRLKITTQVQHPISRQVRRALERKQRPPLDIRVLSLRRTQQATHDVESGEFRSVEWQHQWIVGGHWRNQFYPTLNAHKRVYIAPYTKGPEGKPLKAPAKTIYAVVR